jgi:two-component system response regulator HydG
MIAKMTESSIPVLILGESGAGKERVARAIHCNGPNAAKAFVPVDCRSLVPELVASELFGHVKGAFRGASVLKGGLLSAAGGGTVFINEIGELPLDSQARLLRALQEKEVRPMGATYAVPISARVLAATDRDLNDMVQRGQFRKDLFLKLNVVNVRIPPLRERRKHRIDEEAEEEPRNHSRDDYDGKRPLRESAQFDLHYWEKNTANTGLNVVTGAGWEQGITGK